MPDTNQYKTPVPVNQPGITDQARDATASGYKQQWSKDATRNANRVGDNTQNLRDQSIGYDKSKLDENHGKNIAKGQSQFGTYNNKNYSTTLKMAREANAYNAMPRAEARHYGPRGQVQNLGYGYEKPQLQTMETRAADQALALDTNQKQLAQQLQAAVNAKDLEAFKQAYAQMLGITLTDYQAQNMMTQVLRNQQMADTFNRSAQMWQRNFGMWDSADKLSILNSLYAQNPLMAPLYMSWLGIEAPGMEQMASFGYMQNALTKMYNDPRFKDLPDYYRQAIAQAMYNADTARIEKHGRWADNGKNVADTILADYRKRHGGRT